MAYLTREEFGQRAKAAAPLIPADVDGIGRVAVLQMTQADVEKYVEQRDDDVPDSEAFLRVRELVARYVVDHERRPLFDGPDDAVLMNLTSTQLLDVAAAVVNAAAGVSKDEEPDEGKESATSGGSG